MARGKQQHRCDSGRAGPPLAQAAMDLPVPPTGYFIFFYSHFSPRDIEREKICIERFVFCSATG